VASTWITAATPALLTPITVAVADVNPAGPERRNIHVNHDGSAATSTWITTAAPPS
jgi:hypothetical protein